MIHVISTAIGRRHRSAVPRGFRIRSGAVIVEVAIVCPLVFLLIIGIAVCGIASFRKQQVTTLSNEGARWAAVHAQEYADKNKDSRPGKAEVFAGAIAPLAGSLDPDKLQYSVTWNETDMTVSVSVSYQLFLRFVGQDLTAQSQTTCAILQ